MKRVSPLCVLAMVPPCPLTWTTWLVTSDGWRVERRPTMAHCPSPPKTGRPPAGIASQVMLTL